MMESRGWTPPSPIVFISSHITERQAATAEILMLGPATGWNVRRGGGQTGAPSDHPPIPHF